MNHLGSQRHQDTVGNVKASGSPWLCMQVKVHWWTVLPPAACCFGGAPVGVALQAAKEKGVSMTHKEGAHLDFRPKSASTEVIAHLFLSVGLC